MSEIIAKEQPGLKIVDTHTKPSAPVPPARPGQEMKVADLVVNLHKGHAVPCIDVTPAEALLLTSIHAKNVGGQVIEGVKSIRTIQRSVQEEMARLRMKYHPDKIKACFAGSIPTLPQTYEEASSGGLGVDSPDVDLAPTTKLTV